MGELGFCHYNDVIAGVVNQLAADLAADSGIPLFLVRALHNKIIVGIIYSLRCYLGYLDTAQIFSFVSPFLLPFLIYAFSGLRWRKRIVAAILLFPLIFIFLLKPLEIGTKIYIFRGFYILLAIIGCLKLILKIRIGKN